MNGVGVMVMFEGMGKNFGGFVGILFLQIRQLPANTISDLSKTHYFRPWLSLETFLDF